MDNMKYIAFFYLLFLAGCSSIAPEHFSLKTNSSTDDLALGDTLYFDLSNPKEHQVQSINFSFNGEKTANDFVIINKLGNQRLVVNFTSNNQPITLNQSFTVFANTPPDVYSYKLINTYPHDKNAYTQGLEFYKGELYESTGQYGLSSLRKTDYKTGAILKKLPLNASYFGEGLTFVNDLAVQLTWKENIGFVYDPDDFTLLRSFPYLSSKEGWGLCSDQKIVYKTDGTEKLWKLDPVTFEEQEYVDIVTHNKIISKVNELEFVDGRIYANTYQFNKEVVLIIEPNSGQVVGVVDFSGLKEKVTKHNQLDVFNGIAYHPERRTFFVTGKYWDKLFEVQILKKVKANE